MAEPVTEANNSNDRPSLNGGATQKEAPAPESGAQLGGADGARAAPAAGQGQDARRRAQVCAEFEIDRLDNAGHVIHEIYFKREKYVIYCTDDQRAGDQSDRQILVQYADKPEDADKQIAELADIIPLRNQTQSLLHKVKDKTPYHSQIAEALRLGLEHKPEVGRLILQTAIGELQNIRASEGRNLYVNKAWPYAVGGAAGLLLLAAFMLWLGGIPFTKALSPLAHLAIACAAGALGALLSIAISVRARTVAADGDDMSIRVDAPLRVLIGVISAGVLYLLLGAGALSQLKIGDISFNAGAIVWQLAILIGFASGFLERLVPDMLEKASKK